MTDEIAPPEDPREPATTMHVRRARGGDVKSLEWLVARLTPLLRDHAAYKLGPILRRHYEPDDLVQDAWVAILPRLTELTARDGRHTPVLLRYLSNTIVFRVSKLLRKHTKEVVRSRDAEPPGDTGLEQVSAETSGIITRALRQERVDAVHAALDTLDAIDREIVLLRGIEQVSTATAATIVQLGAEATAKRYQRALTKLRERLPESVFDELTE